MDRLLPIAGRIAALLMTRRETVAVAESSSGGLISAALLSVPGASAYYLGGGVIYTAKARHRLMNLGREDVAGVRSASPAYAAILAATIRDRLGATWGVSETGAAGPTGNPYGDASGHSCIALAGPAPAAKTVETGDGDRLRNMTAFAEEALTLLEQALASIG